MAPLGPRDLPERLERLVYQDLRAIRAPLGLLEMMAPQAFLGPKGLPEKDLKVRQEIPVYQV